MLDTRLPLNIQLFADNSTADDGGTQQQQQDGGKGIQIDYEKIANILQGKRRTIDAFAYIMHEDRPIGVPSIYYMKTCLDGYDTFYFDKQILLNAYKNSMEMCENEK